MNILDIIFEARSEEIAKLNETDKTYLSSHCNSSKAYNDLEKLINELNFESSYFYEKYYKQGLSDGLHLMNDIIT